MKRLISACVAATLAAVPVAEAATRCASMQERTAMRVRAMQTELMVAALSCRAVPGRDFTGQYNTFVQRHGEKLVNHGRILKSYFQSRYGEQSTKKLPVTVPSTPLLRVLTATTLPPSRTASSTVVPKSSR